MKRFRKLDTAHVQFTVLVVQQITETIFQKWIQAAEFAGLSTWRSVENPISYLNFCIFHLDRHFNLRNNYRISTTGYI